MKDTWGWGFLAVLAGFAAGSACASRDSAARIVPAGSSAPATRTRIDWNAGGRWVHLDTVDPAQVALFEGARRRWLATLDATGADWLPDGRPLFWSGRRAAGDPESYVTLYPYDSWQDLAARSQATSATEGRVGGAAVADYDRGDAALVPPHRSELWRRLPEFDYLPPHPIPSEPQGRTALLERRRMPSAADHAKLEILWPRIAEALASIDYGATCRASWSLYGDGTLVLFCMSEDGVPPPSIATALAAQARTKDLAAELDSLLPIEDRLVLRRRDELSHLPR